MTNISRYLMRRIILMKKKDIKYICPIMALLLVIGGFFYIEYSYYIFLRIIVSISAIYMIYRYYKIYKTKSVFIFLFMVIAIIFNPIIMFKSTKSVWKIIDFITAIIFIFPLFNQRLWKSWIIVQFIQLWNLFLFIQVFLHYQILIKH